MRLVISTYGKKEEAEKLAKEFIEKKLVACVSLIPIKSFYVWKDKLEEAEEVLAIFKTSSRKSKRLMKEIKRTHSYEVPEVLEIKVNKVDEDYYNWIKESTSDGKT